MNAFKALLLNLLLIASLIGFDKVHAAAPSYVASAPHLIVLHLPAR